MNDSSSVPEYAQYAPPRSVAIGGTALVGGVHLSTRSFGTGSFGRLFVTGLAMVSIGATAVVLTYVIVWAVGRATGTPLAELRMQLVGPFEVPHFVAWDIFMNLLSFAVFLTVVRLTPLAGYHAAEHKVVHAIERYGYVTLELARSMPRAHRRCGTTLLAGILPAMLIAAPLALVAPGLALLVVLLGWMMRYPVGHAIQQYLTTKEPTEAQLRAGLEAGHKLLAEWRRRSFERVAPVVSFWRRGFLQLLLGVVIGTQLFDWLYRHLHLWLDWEMWLH